MTMYRSLDPVPSIEECAVAVAKACTVRRRRQHGTPSGTLSAEDMDEAVQAVVDAADAIADPFATEMPPVWDVVVSDRDGVRGATRRPQLGGSGDGWWCVGEVVDEIAGEIFTVWYVPGARRIGIGRINPLAAAGFSAN